MHHVMGINFDDLIFLPPPLMPPIPAAPGVNEEDPFLRFLFQSQKTLDDAKFIISTFPNAEKATVEHYLRQLLAIRGLLVSVSDTTLTPEELQALVDCVDAVTPTLDRFYRSEDPGAQPPETNMPTTAGRPSYKLDVDKALYLHSLGNSWEEIAIAMGVDRKTIYNHLSKAGRLPGGGREHTDISNDDLDDVVGFILLKHPLSGQRIMQGHLKGLGISVPLTQVAESLKRIDEIGTLLR